MYARLVEEEGFEGSYSSVQRYVKRWREEHRSDGDGYLELDWSAGVMQVDFGEAVATIGGGDVKVHCLVATFPHSNMRYVAAMPGENAECVCEGLAQIFDHIGMVPRVLVLDNATGAGHRVAWNKVTVVRVFAMFCDHYRLETRFCNPYSGNEKGSVENAVGFLRRNLMVPKPNAESHRQLTRHLLSRCDAIADVDHYRSGRPVRELFDEDRGEMQPLPRARFDAVEWVERKADKEGNIQIGSVRYLAGPSWRGWTLLAGLRAFEVEIRTADGRHVNTLPRSYGDGGRTVRNPATLLPALARKPNAWGESPLRGELPDGLVLRLDALDPGSRRRELTLLHRAGVASGFGNAVLAMAAIVEGGRAPDEASLLALARRIAQGDPPDPDDGAGRLCISSSRCFVFSHVFFSGLGSCMHFPYFSGCAEVFLPNMRASLTRRLWPVNSRSRPWCTMRSMIAAASLSSAKTVPHLLNSMFVVNMMLRLS